MQLVAKKFSQVARVNFNETFIPEAKFITIRCILAIRAAMKLRDSPNELQNIVFKWNIGGGDLHGSIKGVCIRGEEAFSM